MEKNALPHSEVLRVASMLASKYHGYPTRFGNDQNPDSTHIDLGHRRNVLDTNEGESEDSIEANSFIEASVTLDENPAVVDRYIYLLKQAIAVETNSFITRRNANIQLLLVICISLVFLSWTAIGFYILLSTGNSSLLFVDTVPATGFGLVVKRFVFQEKSEIAVNSSGINLK